MYFAYFELRRYAEAEAAMDRARALMPSSLGIIYAQAKLRASRGDLAGARLALAEAHKVADSASVVAYVALREDLLWLLDDAQQRILLTLTPADLDGGRADWAVAVAQTYWRRGDRAKARAYGDTASAAYAPLIRDMQSDADRAQLVGLQALGLAYMGSADEAVRRGTEAIDSARIASAPSGQQAYIQLLMARIHLLVDQPEQSLARLEQAVKTSGNVSPNLLRIDTDFAPLRGNPRFQRLVAGS
jgi:hypothetical protein